MAAVPGFAGEVAVLRNGFSIRHERREVVGRYDAPLCDADGSSFVDVPTAEIEHFEAAPDLAAAPSGPAFRTSERQPFRVLRLLPR